MKIDEVEDILATSLIVVKVRPTKELFPDSLQARELTHFSLVCVSHAEQHRVHNWIEFYRADFEGFDCWAAYVEAISDRSPLDVTQRHIGLSSLLPSKFLPNLPPGGLVC